MQTVEQTLQIARSAQLKWAGQMRRHRLRLVGDVAEQIALAQTELVKLSPRRVQAAEILASELLPLADACRYAARVGKRVLAPSSRTYRGGAWWMGRIGVTVNREPWGIVLVLGPSNYPLFLPGVQIIQALAAGNAVVVKPAPGSEALLAKFQCCLNAAGIPDGLVHVLDSAIQAGQTAIELGVDKVLLTGSVTTGRDVLARCTRTLTPSTLELSGCDAVFVAPQADLKRVARCVAYGVQLNAGRTCIAPRRVFVTHSQLATLSELLVAELHSDPSSPDNGLPISPTSAARVVEVIQDALDSGAQILCGTLPQANTTRMHAIVLKAVTPDMRIAQEDLFCPVVSLIGVEDMAAAVLANRDCPYRLGASVFGPLNYAEHWAEQINAGCIVLNDLIVPTADPRVPFGGRDWSGWGVTRGIDGLVEMTRPKAICTRYGNWLPHLDRRQSNNAELLGLMLTVIHSRSWRTRWSAFRSLIQQARK